MNHTLLNKHLAQTTPYPVGLNVSHASGSWIHTSDGKKYLDMISGLSVMNMGHGSERVKKAVNTQLEKHAHVMVYGEYEQTEPEKLAKLLTDQLPEHLNTCYFLNSGAEACEAAIKLCRRSTGRSELIAFRGSYHGGTTGALAISHNEEKKFHVRPLMPAVQFIGLNSHVDLAQITERTAGVFLETIQGDAGIRIPSAEFMQSLRKRCDEVGALLVLDEIQAGMGRTGTLFAFQHYGIEPDILCLGKALGAGLPIGAMVSSRAHMEKFTHDPMLGHITTFGGNPVVCAAARAGLEELLESEVMSEVGEKGKLLCNAINAHPSVKAVRNKGLFIAVDLVSEQAVQTVFDYCLEHGVITFWFLSCPTAFRLAPPLNISKDDLEHAIEIILKGLDQVR